MGGSEVVLAKKDVGFGYRKPNHGLLACGFIGRGGGGGECD